MCNKTYSNNSNLERHVSDAHEGKPRSYIKHEIVDGKLLCKICQETFKYHRDVKSHYIKEHSGEELSKNGITMKVLKKRADKRSIKMLEKSELEVQIEKEEEKRALNLSEAVL